MTVYHRRVPNEVRLRASAPERASDYGPLSPSEVSGCPAHVATSIGTAGRADPPAAAIAAIISAQCAAFHGKNKYPLCELAVDSYITD